MMPIPAEAIFELPFMSVKDVIPVNDKLAPAVQSAFSRDRATVRKRIIRLDGLILSQYARIISVRRLILRTLNIDMALWFAAGLDSPLAVVLDPRIARVIAAAAIDVVGNFAFTSEEVSATEPDASAVFADRADVVEFIEAICDDILSGRHSYLFIHDVIDVPGRRFIDAAREGDIRVEVIPGPRSYAVFSLSGVGTAAAVARLLRTYAERAKMAPELLRPRLRDKRSPDLLNNAIARLLDETWEACAIVDRIVGGGGARPAISSPQEGPSEVALALASEICAILDPRNNQVAAIAARHYRERADAVRVGVQQLLAGEAHFGKVRDRLFTGYALLWQFFHLVVSWSSPSLAGGETFRLALARHEECVIAPMAFKPFREHAFVYQFQDFEFRRQSLTAPTRAVDRSTLAAPIDHYVRIWQLVALIEMLFAIIRRERPGETIRWLDLGCGMGDAVNCVRLEDCLHDENWEIVGVDWNESSLRIAKKDAGPRRKFLVGDVEAAIGQVGAESFNIISAFEFIEHLEDPVKSLKRYSPLCSDFFVAGSPLAERQHWVPAATHIWTFDRRGFEETLLAAGFAASFASEAYVGKYASGHDWVTVIAGARRKLPRSITMHGSG